MSLLWAAPLAAQTPAPFDLQGHRGARGLAPENSLAAFAAALAVGVTTLELDVVMSRDGRVMVSHNRRLNPSLTRDGTGAWITAPGPAINSLTAAQLRAYDIGRLDPASPYARKFPDQVAADGSAMPYLEEVFALAGAARNTVVRFNIETKSSPEAPTLTPPPERFVAALLAVIDGAAMAERVTIQSFDWRTLAVVRRLAPGITTSYLSAQRPWLDNIRAGAPGPSPWTAGLDIDDFDGNVAALIAAAGGDVWSPYHRDVDGAKIRDAQKRGLKVKVWTVNDVSRMAALIDLGVDGIITDYPDRLRAVLAVRGMVPPPPTPLQP